MFDITPYLVETRVYSQGTTNMQSDLRPMVQHQSHEKRNTGENSCVDILLE